MGASVIAVLELSKTPRAWSPSFANGEHEQWRWQHCAAIPHLRQEQTLETECRVLTASSTMALIPAPLRPPYRADFGATSRRP